MRISIEKNRTQVDLLLITDAHYYLINNMSRLLSSQTSKHKKVKEFASRQSARNSNHFKMDVIEIESQH